MYAAVALVAATLAAPSRPSAMGGGSCTPPTVALDVSPVAPGVLSQATVTCTSPTLPAGYTLALGVADGLLVDPVNAVTVTSLPVASGEAVAWATPGVSGYYAVTCDFPAVGGFPTGICAQTVTKSVPVGINPPLVGGISGQLDLLVGTPAAYSVVATDSNTPALPLTYAWSASGGTVTQDPQNPAAATWQAPATAGQYTLTVTVSNGVASSSSSKTLNALIATFRASLPLAIDAPRRICAAQDGFDGLFVVDGRQGTPGDIGYLNVRGELRGFASVPESVIAVAQGAGFLWATTAPGNVFKLDGASGRVLAKWPLVDAGQPLLKPFGIAYEPSRMTVWVTELDAERVRIFRPDGTPVAIIGTAGGVPLGAPIDVAVDEGGAKVWVLDKEPNAAGLFLHAYDLDGNYLASILDTSALSRGGGLAVAPNGRVYVTDAFQGVVQVLDRDGGFLGTIGQFGEQNGQLIAPYDAAVMTNGDVAVVSPTNGRVERYGTGTPLPASCTVDGKVDSDCDGLSDEWELAHGTNPNDASDALAAFGSTGLNNYEVASYQTKYGTDPWAPAVTAVGPTAEVPPGRVKLTATSPGSALYTMRYSWRFLSGPTPVPLAGADTDSPTVVVRKPGLYKFEVVGATELGTGPASQVSLIVKNVPPVPEGGRVVVTSAGGAVTLDGGLSSDANGDALSYAWDQTLGAAVIGTAPGPTLTVRPRTAGLYKFLLTAKDTAGLTASVEVPVLVAGPAVTTAIGTASPAAARVGEPVSLDATASLFGDAAPVFLWEQIEGAAAVLLGPDRPVATFVPATAGRYAFALTVLDRMGRRSPPARVDVFVSEAGGAIPEIQAASVAAAIVDVNSAVALSATGTGTGYAWKQVAGPAAGLGDADTGSATAVPFSPGWYVFEVSATAGSGVGAPWRVAFEARSNGQPIPVARIATPAGTPVAGQLVFLDGRGSTGAARYRWTQVAGPWAALSAQGQVTMFRPPDPGTYAFELEVDDGRVRSAPTRIEINVTENGVN